MAVGLTVNGAVVLLCLAATVLAMRADPGPRRSGALATLTSAVVVAAAPLLVAVNRSLEPVHPGDRDLSGAWSWALVVIAAGAAAVAVYLRPDHGRSLPRVAGAPDDDVVPDGGSP